MAYRDVQGAIYRRMARRFGVYVTARHMANQGLPIQMALRILTKMRERK